MATDLTGIERKLVRAERHLADLKYAVEARFDPNKYRFELNRDTQTQHHILTAHDLPELDPEWGPVIGDCLFNLRSALDHLAWQLVLLDGGTPGEQTQFPIRPSPFDKNGQLLAPNLQPSIRNPNILKALEEVQPYRGPEGEPVPFTISPLWRLSRLNNIDKHRLLLVVVSVLDVDKMWFGSKQGDTVPALTVSTQPVKEGSPVADFDFFGEEPPANFDPHPALAVALREPAMPEIRMVSVVNLLINIAWSVGVEVFQMRFRPLFP